MGLQVAGTQGAGEWQDAKNVLVLRETNNVSTSKWCCGL